MKSLLRPPLTFNTAPRMYDYLMKLTLAWVAVKGSRLAEIIAPLLPGQEGTLPQSGTPLKGQPPWELPWAGRGLCLPYHVSDSLSATFSLPLSLTGTVLTLPPSKHPALLLSPSVPGTRPSPVLTPYTSHGQQPHFL